MDRVTATLPRPPFLGEPCASEWFERCRRLTPKCIEAKFTYFMRDNIGGLVKIGASIEPECRRAHLSSSGARDMEILLVLRGGHLERAYHRHFADLRLFGEWFWPHTDIRDEIERMKPLAV